MHFSWCIRVDYGKQFYGSFIIDSNNIKTRLCYNICGKLLKIVVQFDCRVCQQMSGQPLTQPYNLQLRVSWYTIKNKNTKGTCAYNL